MEPFKTIAISPTDRALLLHLLHEHLPDLKVWAYGSRVDGTASPASDLDLVVFASCDDRPHISALREAMQESNLTFRVDLHRWDDLPPEFQERIMQSHAVLL